MIKEGEHRNLRGSRGARRRARALRRRARPARPRSRRRARDPRRAGGRAHPRRGRRLGLLRGRPGAALPLQRLRDRGPRHHVPHARPRRGRGRVPRSAARDADLRDDLIESAASPSGDGTATTPASGCTGRQSRPRGARRVRLAARGLEDAARARARADASRGAEALLDRSEARGVAVHEDLAATIKCACHRLLALAGGSLRAFFGLRDRGGVIGADRLAPLRLRLKEPTVAAADGAEEETERDDPLQESRHGLSAVQVVCQWCSRLVARGLCDAIATTEV